MDDDCRYDCPDVLGYADDNLFGFCPAKTFYMVQNMFDRHLVPVERFKWYGISLLWQIVPIKRFRWNKMVFALRFVLFERMS